MQQLPTIKTLPQSSFKRNLLTLAVVSVLATGCFSSDDDEKTPLTSTVSGTAAKGIVKNALVTAYALKEDGNKGTMVGSAVTADDGSYTLKTTADYDSKAALLLELSPQKGTMMVCDAPEGCGTTIKRGEDMSLEGTDFLLTSIIPATTSGATVNAAITPFTDMAAKRIQDSGNVTSAQILNTTSRVSQLVGVDILDAKPVNIADKTTLAEATAVSQQYTVMLAALAKQAFTDTDANGISAADMISNLKRFSNDFVADGDIGDAEGLSPAALYKAAGAEVERVKDSLHTDAATATKQLATVMSDQIDDDGKLAPAPTSGEHASDIAQAKQMVKEVRNWATSLADLENPANDFAEHADTISKTLGQDAEVVLEVYIQAATQTLIAIADSIDDKTTLPAKLDITDSNNKVLGTVTLTEASPTTGSKKYTMTADDLSGVTLDTTLAFNVDPAIDTLEAGDITANIAGSASNKDVYLGLKDAALTATLDKKLIIRGENADDDEASRLAAVMLKGKLNAKEQKDNVATGNQVAADAEIKFISLNENSIYRDTHLGLQKFALNNATVTSDKGSAASLGITLEVNNAAKFDALGYLDAQPQLYIYRHNYNNDTKLFDFSKAKKEFAIEKLTHFNYRERSSYNNDSNSWSYELQTCAAGTDAAGGTVTYDCRDGDLIGANEQAAKLYPQYYVDSVKVDYINYYHGDTNAGIKLTLNDMEDADHFLDASLSITTQLNLAGREAATLIVTGKKDGLDKGNMTATLGYSGKVLKLTASTTNGEEDGTEALLKFSNASGVSMTLSHSKDWKSGNITVNEHEVAVIEEVKGTMIIRYNDGVIETL